MSEYGFIAFGLGICGMSQSIDKRLKLLLSAQNVVLAVHFYLLGASGGAASACITAVRNILSVYSSFRYFAFVFSALYITLIHHQAEFWYDYLPMLSAVISTIGIFYLDEVPMRRFLLVSTALWFVHNAVVGSIGPMMMEMMLFIANLKVIIQMQRRVVAN